MTEIETPIPATPAERDIVAKPDTWFRGKRLIFAVALVVLGCWFAYDGWIGWPRENEKAKGVEGVLKLPHSDLDLLFQKVLASILPSGNSSTPHSSSRPGIAASTSTLGS